MFQQFCVNNGFERLKHLRRSKQKCKTLGGRSIRTPIINRSPIILERVGVSGVPVLSGDFNRGYTKAIMDITEVFSYIQDDLRHHHKSLTAKSAKELLECILQNRAQLREQNLLCGRGFIRYNGTSQKFEWFEGRR